MHTKQTQAVFIARLETANFTFEAYGTDEANAREILRAAFEKHISAAKGWLTWEEVEPDVWVEKRNFGESVIW